MKSIYFDELQQRVRDIRSSQRSAMAKIADVIAEAMDYDSKKLSTIMMSIKHLLQTQENAERFANFLLYIVEARANGKEATGNKAKAYSAWVMSDVETLAKHFAICRIYKHDPGDDYLYRYPCYNGVWFAREGEEPNSSVRLPQELQDCNKHYVVLRVQGMNRLIEHCSDPISGRPRPYDILARLDHLIVDCLPEGVFPANPLITADVESGQFDSSHFPFKFSHFEVDMQEPDPDFRTLYVVYSY